MSFLSDPAELAAQLSAADHRRTVLVIHEQVDVVDAGPVAGHMNDPRVGSFREMGFCLHASSGRLHDDRVSLIDPQGPCWFRVDTDQRFRDTASALHP